MFQLKKVFFCFTHIDKNISLAKKDRLSIYLEKAKQKMLMTCSVFSFKCISDESEVLIEMCEWLTKKTHFSRCFRWHHFLIKQRKARDQNSPLDNSAYRKGCKVIFFFFPACQISIKHRKVQVVVFQLQILKSKKKVSPWENEFGQKVS